LVISCLLVRPDSVGKYNAGILSDTGIVSGASAPKPLFPADQEEKARIVKEQARTASSRLKKALHIMSVKQSFQAKSKKPEGFAALPDVLKERLSQNAYLKPPVNT
jgi:hypothetical protein